MNSILADAGGYFRSSARGFIVVFGCAAILWSSVELPKFWQESLAQRIGNQVIAGDQFKREILIQQLRSVGPGETSGHCRPATFRSVAIMHLRLTEIALASNRKKSDEDLKSLSKVIRNSLTCLPSDPFLWLVLYWSESTQSGINSESLQYLRLSYELGPNEGWIVLKRNPVALAAFSKLPSDLAADAINEFAALLNVEFFQQAVEIFSGANGVARDAIVSHVAKLPLQIRKEFSQAMFNRGITLTIPGVEIPDSKPPWH